MQIHFDTTITLNGLVIAGSVVTSVVMAVWRIRGRIDTFQTQQGMQFAASQEEMKKRHRQNTNRLDWMLGLINRGREEAGKDPVLCPYREIVDP